MKLLSLSLFLTILAYLKRLGAISVVYGGYKRISYPKEVIFCLGFALACGE